MTLVIFNARPQEGFQPPAREQRPPPSYLHHTSIRSRQLTLPLGAVSSHSSTTEGIIAKRYVSRKPWAGILALIYLSWIALHGYAAWTAVTCPNKDFHQFVWPLALIPTLPCAYFTIQLGCVRSYSKALSAALGLYPLFLGLKSLSRCKDTPKFEEVQAIQAAIGIMPSLALFASILVAVETPYANIRDSGFRYYSLPGPLGSWSAEWMQYRVDPQLVLDEEPLRKVSIWGIILTGIFMGLLLTRSQSDKSVVPESLVMQLISLLRSHSQGLGLNLAVEYCCGECLDHEASGKWAAWRTCDASRFKKSDLTDHEKAIQNGKHKFKQLPVHVAFKQIIAKNEATEASRMAEELLLVNPLADLALTLAIEEVALLKSEAFLQWAEKHGLKVTKHWRSVNYGWQFIQAAHSIQLADIKVWLSGHKFGIIVDESTDISVTKQIILYIKSRGQTRYVGLRDMHGDGSGEAIKNAAVGLLEALQLPKEDLISVTSDGHQLWVNLTTGDVFDAKTCTDGDVLRIAADVEACLLAQLPRTFYQRADAALGDLIDDMESDDARKFAVFMRKRLRARIPAMSTAQEAQVHDFRLLNPDSEAAGNPLVGSVFSKKLITRAAHSHWSIHSRHYGCSEEDFVTAFKKTNRRLSRQAHVRRIYNERLLDIELKEKPDDRQLKIYRLVLEIESSVAVDSCEAERVFSALQRIRSKTRNRLQGVNLDAAMSLSINATPACEEVVKVWSTIKPRRKKVAAKRATKRDRDGIPVASSSDEEDFVYDDVLFEGNTDEECWRAVNAFDAEEWEASSSLLGFLSQLWGWENVLFLAICYITDPSNTLVVLCCLGGLILERVLRECLDLSVKGDNISRHQQEEVRIDNPTLNQALLSA
ncbi:hypothetical protein Pmar_PMAR028687 [Perkinsus marinus ATCC 50983]|uniref:DUF4371 domain-containing protein n=1 Tax=Perkinsus marinus (strain ATCC 50983 / TXsc) TaxID=423536 RepID=C5K8L4_PERM5|nr:hypothetical protein Pmar_PMAR028687 [Perkinsus marinus ATCC 50983]EER19221.1 hypothetical protein Pmar_PMAR028687 [Perkinsus marinus ATCC 50983]|eukprot:XP_002787425.1 hypothetical protein Pmar_PMAR028687 [Perkinsus marinus ATCC 50983]